MLAGRHDHQEHVTHHSVCHGSEHALTPAQIAEGIESTPGWEERGGRLRRTFRFPSFDDTMRFVDRMAELAQSANHHPDFSVSDKRVVSVELWTHKMGCLTSLDFDLAMSINEVHDLMVPGE
ncbi:4a-hydroxytetrahydrobiopterin dehydratase [Amycolatopsis sp. cmx-4-61]|uniref:4a-hydroxytetrahydrobiopterin dehydratase n=1 Tax=Amycolatopsis sp. cmx-4-61 TaxID=2790937 RepID=UPI00397B01A0